MTKKNKFVCCGIHLQPETAEGLCNSPTKPWEVHRSPDNVKAPWEPQSLPPPQLPAELRAWHSCSETPPLPAGLPRVCISAKTSAHCFSLLWNKWLCKGMTRSVTAAPRPVHLWLHVKAHQGCCVHGSCCRYTETCLDKLHSYYLADF